MITEPLVIRATDGSRPSLLRRSVDLGDYIVLGPVRYWMIASQDDIERHYANLGVELWSDWRWDDSPRRPKVKVTLVPNYRYAYGTLSWRGTSQSDCLFRYLGGDWWEVVG